MSNLNALSNYEKQLSNDELKSVLGGGDSGTSCGCDCYCGAGGDPETVQARASDNESGTAKSSSNIKAGIPTNYPEVGSSSN